MASGADGSAGAFESGGGRGVDRGQTTADSATAVRATTAARPDAPKRTRSLPDCEAIVGNPVSNSVSRRITDKPLSIITRFADSTIAVQEGRALATGLRWCGRGETLSSIDPSCGRAA